MKRTAVNILIGLLLALAICSLTACAGSIAPIWAAENRQYESTVVEGTLLPHYMADPAIPQAAKDNVKHAVDEHKTRLTNWEGGGA